MKIIIPYRELSQRCKNKNLRKFSNGKSLLEITIEKFTEHDVILASIPSERTQSIAKKYGCTALDLNEEDTGWSELFHEIATKAESIARNEPVCFWTATEITYFINNTIQDFISFGKKNLQEKDKSTMLVRKMKHFFVDENFLPDNFNPGAWHPYSQFLKQKYIVGWASITTRNKMQKYRYYWEPSCEAYIAKGPYVDIDTEEEFKTAQILWKASIG